MTTLIGLDLSLTATAVATSAGEFLITEPRQRGVRRLIAIRDAVLDKVLDGFLTDTHVVAVVEDYAFSRAVAHAHELGELGGVVRVTLYEAKIPYVDVKPTALKKFATGRGNATKPDMRTERFKRTGVDERDDNLNDAFWLRQMGLCAYADPSALLLPAVQMAVVGDLTWPVVEVKVGFPTEPARWEQEAMGVRTPTGELVL